MESALTLSPGLERPAKIPLLANIVMARIVIAQETKIQGCVLTSTPHTTNILVGYFVLPISRLCLVSHDIQHSIIITQYIILKIIRVTAAYYKVKSQGNIKNCSEHWSVRTTYRFSFLNNSYQCDIYKNVYHKYSIPLLTI